jgi:hypothetical protein
MQIINSDRKEFIPRYVRLQKSRELSKKVNNQHEGKKVKQYLVASQAVLIYQTIQRDELECYHTWTAVMSFSKFDKTSSNVTKFIHQSQAGVIVLFCLYANPSQLQPEICPRVTIMNALDTYFTILEGYASCL